MTETPVLFLIFNRPALTEQVFAQIKKAQPKQLFIGADGPRDDKPGEKDLCEATRKIVMQNIDWPCEVKTFFREKNAGCNTATIEAMNWFFDNVEQGIMIEDDCLPALSYFRFCDELLELYKNDDRIITVSGVNFFEKYNISSSYFFSIHGASWAMGTWKRAWRNFDYSISAWGNKDVKNKIRKFMNNDNLFKYYSEIFDWHLKDNNNGVWDYRWLFCRLVNQGLSVVPAFNQSKNIGFGFDATHTLNAESKLGRLGISEIAFPLQINYNIVPDKSYDSKIYEEFIKSSKINLRQKIARRFKEYLKH